jgi:hypothetical protein
MKDFLLDASVALGWLIDDPPSPYAGRVQQLMIARAQPLVPVHWHLEIANALLMAERRKILRRELSEILADISALIQFIETDDLQRDIGTPCWSGTTSSISASFVCNSRPPGSVAGAVVRRSHPERH